jgi:hypothetical protein
MGIGDGTGGRAIAASPKKINKSGGLRKTREKEWIRIEILKFVYKSLANLEEKFRLER